MTTRTDWRRTCAELIEDVCYLIDCVDHDCCDPVALMECREHLSQTRTALSQPEPEAVGPTIKEVSDWVARQDDDWTRRVKHHDAIAVALAAIHDFTHNALPVPGAEVPPMPVPGDAEGLAEVFWGRYAQPEPEGPTDQDLDDLANEMLDWNREGWRAYARAAIAADRARWGYPATKPVPVAERPWEREKGWRDPDGECWWCPPDGPPYWQMANPAMVYGGWLLPPHALPLPTPTP